MNYFMILMLVLTTSFAALAEEGVYKPAGTPADPKVDVRWNRYHDYAEATKILKDLAAAHPNRCRLISLGKSYGGREMWVLTISNFDEGDADAKPAFWMDGGIHANELQGPEVVLYSAWYLLEMDGKVDFITNLLKERTFYMLPMMSPDSRDSHMHEANTTHSPRTGQRPRDDDRDGLVDEDPADDMDGDGHIVQMRIKDPNGNMKPHPKYPDYLIPVEPGEKGQYRYLGSEGLDDDGDGRANEDGPGFYDPNRDWAYKWQPQYIQRGAYRYPFSILENRMMADFVLKHPNIAGAQSFHNAGGMILRGPAVPGDSLNPRDLRVYENIGRKGERMLPGYGLLEIATELYPVWGGETDWLYNMRGAIAFTNELWTGFNMFREGDRAGGYRGQGDTNHEFNQLLLFGDGFVPWHEVDHPIYGKVELGGFKKNWMRQPPGFLMEEELHRNMAFCLYHADQLPQVSIQSVEIEDMGNGLRQVTVIVENKKVQPTRLAVDVENKITRPDQVTINGNDLQVVAAMVSGDPNFIRASEQELRPQVVELETIGGQDIVYVRWLITGKGPFDIRVDSVKGGAATIEIEE